VQLTWTLTRTAGKPFAPWDGFDEWNKKTRVVHLGTRNLGYRRQPTLIHEQMMFAAEFATIGRVSARVIPTRRRGHTGSVNASSIPYDLVVLAQPSEHGLVDALPNASLHSFVKPTPTSHAAAAAEFTRQIFPRYPGLEHKQNPG
jgi:hypothetical protein